MKPSIDEQIEAVRYAARAEALDGTGPDPALEAALATLEWVRRHAPTIKSVLGEFEGAKVLPKEDTSMVDENDEHTTIASVAIPAGTLGTKGTVTFKIDPTKTNQKLHVTKVDEDGNVLAEPIESEGEVLPKGE